MSVVTTCCTCRFLDACRLLESLYVLPVESGQRLIFHPCRYFFSKSNGATNKRHFQMHLSLYVACCPFISWCLMLNSLSNKKRKSISLDFLERSRSTGSGFGGVYS